MQILTSETQPANPMPCTTVRPKELINQITHTTRFITSPLTLSPISGDISEPNCCSVVRNRFNLLSCRAPQAGGSCVTLFPILLGETGPVGLVWTPLTAGEVELLDSDLTSATTGTDEGFAFGDDTGGPWGGWAAGSVGESGMLASLKSVTSTNILSSKFTIIILFLFWKNYSQNSASKKLSHKLTFSCSQQHINISIPSVKEVFHLSQTKHHSFLVNFGIWDSSSHPGVGMDSFWNPRLIKH